MFGYRLEQPPPVDHYYDGPGPLAFGDYDVLVHHTPGHCPGNVCLQVGRRGERGMDLFVGDTLFAGSIGRTDLPGGDYETLMRAITGVLLPLGDDARVHPGHGPDTTIGHERRTNEFLLEWAGRPGSPLGEPAPALGPADRELHPAHPQHVAAASSPLRTRLPFTNVPLVLSRSSTSTPSSCRVSRQCSRETSGASTTKSARGARPTVLIDSGQQPEHEGVGASGVDSSIHMSVRPGRQRQPLVQGSGVIVTAASPPGNTVFERAVNVRGRAPAARASHDTIQEAHGRRRGARRGRRRSPTSSTLNGAATTIDPSRLATVELGTMTRSVVATGKIEPITKVEIKSKANGIIERLAVDVDHRVEPGQVLAELDKENLNARLREARANLEAARAALTAAEAQARKNEIEAEAPELAFAKSAYDRASRSRTRSSSRRKRSTRPAATTSRRRTGSGRRSRSCWSAAPRSRKRGPRWRRRRPPPSGPTRSWPTPPSRRQSAAPCSPATSRSAARCRRS